MLVRNFFASMHNFYFYLSNDLAFPEDMNLSMFALRDGFLKSCRSEVYVG